MTSYSEAGTSSLSSAWLHVPVYVWLCSVALGLLTLWWGMKSWQRSKLPKGPKGVPLFGNILDIDVNKPCERFLQWADQYRGIYTINMMGTNIVVLNKLDTIRECYVTKSGDFAGRPYMYRLRQFARESLEISTFTVSPEWTALKRATTHAMKLCGEGIQQFEDITLDILQDLVTSYEEQQNQPIDILHEIHDALASIVTSLVYGKRLDDKEVRRLVDIDAEARQVIAPNGKGCELDFLPWLRYIPGYSSNRSLRSAVKNLWDWHDGRCVQDYRRRRRSSAMLEQGAIHLLMKNQKNNTGKLLFEDESINSTAASLMFAGVTTTSMALYSLFLLLLHNPTIQDRARAEITEVVGARTPKLSDRASCHFIESMILEVLRYISHVPMSLPHETTRDTSIREHKIPAFTQVWTDLFSLHHDAEIWTKPWDFVPDRFLDQEGHLVAVDHPLRKQLFPFGAGRRSCLGEVLARNRMFLFITVLLQRFTFQPDPSHPLPDPDPRGYTVGIVLSPPSYKCKLTSRE